VPEPRGLDELGREVLSYIPGEVPHEMPDWIWSERLLMDVARALRQWHDATVDFEFHDGTWSLASRGPEEVVCHNDFAPYNCVFQDGLFVGAIDFDQCAPGPRLWDLAYTAYRFVPLMPDPGADPSELAGEGSPFSRTVMAQRLRTFLEAYTWGEDTRYAPEAVLELAVDRLEALAHWTANHALSNGVLSLVAHAARYRAHARWLRTWNGAG
jgi:Ser/Thr protein kinase RdoA (MazF antagonist)